MALDHFALQPGRSLPAAGNLPGDAAALPDPRTILNSIGEVIYDWDLVSDRIVWGANICEVLGLSHAAGLSTGKGFAEVLAPESPGTRYEAVRTAAEGDPDAASSFQVHYGLVLPERNPRGGVDNRVWIEDTGRVFCDGKKRALRAHGIIRVISEQFEAGRQTAFRSIFDPMTGALNRANLTGHITRLLAQADGKSHSFATLLVGIRGLARINHDYSYDVADELIAGLIGRLRGNLRANDVVGRYSGNKFALVLDHCDGEQMQEAARRLMAIVDSDPVATSAGIIPVSIQIGAILAPRYARTAQVLLQHAEEALEATRAPGRKPFVAFMPALSRDEARQRVVRMTDEVLSALNERRILLACQPIVAAGSGQIVAHEALMRLRAADGSLVTPGNILPLAEKAGLIGMIDHRMLELTLARLVAVPEAQLAFNISAATVQDGEWPHRLKAALALSPGAAGRLMIEITETIAVENLDATGAAIQAMQKLGVRVAMDDFGAGHTSFRNLRHLGFDQLKIDGAFMQNLARSPDDRLFVRTLLELARHLGIPTVAEWVEDAETAKILAGWGVDFLQGHHFGRAEIIGDIQTGGGLRSALAG